jgi:hypothetical protein
MHYFVNVKVNEVTLRKGELEFSDLYDACGYAAALVSDLGAKRLTEGGKRATAVALAVEVENSEGNVVLRFPINS